MYGAGTAHSFVEIIIVLPNLQDIQLAAKVDIVVNVTIVDVPLYGNVVMERSSKDVVMNADVATGVQLYAVINKWR
jgi:hypothetical protein